MTLEYNVVNICMVYMVIVVAIGYFVQGVKVFKFNTFSYTIECC